MIKKYRFGDPFETEAVVENIQAEHGEPKFGETSIDNGFSFSYMMDEDEIVYGLGEANRGINKRGLIKGDTATSVTARMTRTTQRTKCLCMEPIISLLCLERHRSGYFLITRPG